MTTRAHLLRSLQASRAAGRPDFARSLAADWLARWPNDLEVQFLMAQVEVEQGEAGSAARRLRQVVAADPEYVEAYDLMSVASRAAGDPLRATLARAGARAVRKERPDDTGPSWLGHLNRAQAELEAGNTQAAVRSAQEALLADPDIPLPALVMMRALEASGETSAAVATARAAHDRWPECVAFTLALGEDLLRRGENARAVEYLHRAASNDPVGRVAKRLLGRDNPYRTLWSETLEADIARPIPAEVAAILGDNRLATAGPASAAPAPRKNPDETQVDAGTPVSAPAPVSVGEDLETFPGTDGPAPQPMPWESFRGPDPGDDQTGESPDLARIREDLDRMAARLRSPQASTEIDRRRPAYIILSSRTRLIQQLGQDRFDRIDEAALALAAAVATRPDWTAHVVYPDDPASLKPFRLTPVDPGNAWQMKLRLADLDRSLARKGEMIGAVLIVGGDAIVPFHQLPNPTDDDDQTVASDNPYGTTDENYLAPEWPVGRLPLENDADLLARLLARGGRRSRLGRPPRRSAGTNPCLVLEPLPASTEGAPQVARLLRQYLAQGLDGRVPCHRRPARDGHLPAGPGRRPAAPGGPPERAFLLQPARGRRGSRMVRPS